MCITECLHQSQSTLKPLSSLMWWSLHLTFWLIFENSCNHLERKVSCVWIFLVANLKGDGHWKHLSESTKNCTKTTWHEIMYFVISQWWSKRYLTHAVSICTKMIGDTIYNMCKLCCYITMVLDNIKQIFCTIYTFFPH